MFQSWLANDRRPCHAINKLRSSVCSDPLLIDNVDSSVSILLGVPEMCVRSRECDLQAQTARDYNVSGSSGADRSLSISSARSTPQQLFLPFQRHMLEVSLKDERCASLDPSRDARAEDTYSGLRKWIEATDQCIRFSHDSVSSFFRHGEHEYENDRNTYT